MTGAERTKPQQLILAEVSDLSRFNASGQIKYGISRLKTQAVFRSKMLLWPCYACLS